MNNPYSHLPEEQCIAVRTKASKHDVQLIQSVFPGQRAGFVTAAINSYVKLIADHIRKHKLTFDNQSSVESAVESLLRAGLSDPQPHRETGGPDERAGAPGSHSEAQGVPVNVAVGEVSRPKKNVKPVRVRGEA
jgi:hypothetical protein